MLLARLVPDTLVRGLAVLDRTNVSFARIDDGHRFCLGKCRVAPRASGLYQIYLGLFLTAPGLTAGLFE
jgi:hypothetical protein